MIFKESELIKEQRIGAWEGYKTKLLQDEMLQEKCKLFAKISVKPGHSVPLHKHIDDFEAYYILNGKAKANDNGVESFLEAGDVLFTKSGECHSIENIGNNDLEFIALILPK
ncbi:MAG: cupin domain-containing protein [Bacillota bacterium]